MYSYVKQKQKDWVQFSEGFKTNPTQSGRGLVMQYWAAQCHGVKAEGERLKCKKKEDSYVWTKWTKRNVLNHILYYLLKSKQKVLAVILLCFSFSFYTYKSCQKQDKRAGSWYN